VRVFLLCSVFECLLSLFSSRTHTTECPLGSILSSMKTESGFWRQDSSSDEFHDCGRFQDACEGGTCVCDAVSID